MLWDKGSDQLPLYSTCGHAVSLLGLFAEEHPDYNSSLLRLCSVHTHTYGVNANYQL